MIFWIASRVPANHAVVSEIFFTVFTNPACSLCTEMDVGSALAASLIFVRRSPG